MSALDFEEAVHKLLKINIDEGQEVRPPPLAYLIRIELTHPRPQVEMCNMIIECCSQERSYSKFFGLMGERFAKLHQSWSLAYEECFATYYSTIHRYETNRLRNIARFFGHLLATDAIPWTVLDAVHMTEDDTTSSSRIFVKIMFQEVTEGMGLKKVQERLGDPSLRGYLGNIFPVDNPKDTRFSINFFTSIGLGAVTEEMREHLKRAPALIVSPLSLPFSPFPARSPFRADPHPRWNNAEPSKTSPPPPTLPPPNPPSPPPRPTPTPTRMPPDPRPGSNDDAPRRPRLGVALLPHRRRAGGSVGLRRRGRRPRRGT